MRRLLSVTRFFLVVLPMPLLMLGAFVVVTIVASGLILMDPSRAAGALTPILLLQLFASASGFEVPARRGHFDLLLTHGVPRLLIVVGHWVASVLPGLISWLAVATVCRLVAPAEAVSLFSAGTITAVAAVSTIPWAATARLPRFSGAIGWLLILVTASLLIPLPGIDITSPDSGWNAWFVAAVAVLVYPPLLVGQALTGRNGLLVLLVLILSGTAVFVAVWSISRRDIPLEAAQ